MDIKSKNTDNETEETNNKSKETTKQTLFTQEETPSPPAKGSIGYKLRAKWIRVAAFILSAVLAAYGLTALQVLSCCEYIWDIEAAVMGDEQPQTSDKLQYSDDIICPSEIETFYDSLCTVASQVFRYSDKDFDSDYMNDINSQLNEYFSESKVYFDEGDGFNSLTVETKRLDYYVCYGDRYDTNIPDIKAGAGYDELAAALDDDNAFYIRKNNKIYTGGKNTDLVGYNNTDVSFDFMSKQPELALGSAYYDEQTLAHIYRYSKTAVFHTLFENYDLLLDKYKTQINDDGEYEVNVPYYKGSDRYIYDKAFDDYRMDKRLSPVDDSGITVAIGVRPVKQLSAAAGTEKLSRDEQLGLSKALIISLIPVGAVIFVIVIMLMVRCGYNRDTGTFTPSKWLDKRFTAELFLLAATGAMTAAIALMSELGGEIDIAFGKKNTVFFLSFALGMFLLWIIGFGSVLVMLRKLKTRTFFKTSAVCGLFGFTAKGISQAIKKGENRLSVSAYNKLTVARKMLVRNLIFAAATAIAIIFLMVAVFENWVEYDNIMIVGVYETFYFVYFIWYCLSSIDYFHDSDKLCRKIDTIGTGEKYTGEPMSKTSAFFEPFKVLDTLDERIKTQAEEMVKSERTKVELVTNVSHDLKTPLTSIISYTYLLSKEEMSDEAKDYVKILQQKTEKLKSIVNDVFTLAKAASGAEVKKEKLELTMLVNQTLAGSQDIIEKSGLTVKTQLPDTPVYIIGDGDKLSRVFQNLLDNALKYSLDGTRVFVEMTAGERTEVAFKNTARDEMTFTAEEITERFTRGDKSRTDGGSGLGLSIAKTFTEACGGEFRIELEGDMFKAIAGFEVFTEEEETADGEQQS